MTQQTARSPVDVLHADVLSSIGIANAARLIGRSPGVLYNKFGESMHNELTVHEAMAIAKAVKRTGFAEAVCENFGGVFMPLPDGEAGADDVLQAYLDIISRMGDLSNEFTRARADGVIDRREFEVMQRRAEQTVVAVMHMISELETLVRDVPHAVVSHIRAA